MKKIDYKSPKRRNPVAKFGRTFNKGGAHRDRTKYDKKSKQHQWNNLKDGLMSTIEDYEDDEL